MDVFSSLTVSKGLGFLALLNYLTIFGYAFWKMWPNSNDNCDVDDDDSPEDMEDNDYVLIMKCAAFTVGFFVLCFPALWCTWYFADRLSPDWQWSIGSLHIAGSHASWILLLIFWLTFIGIRRTNRELEKTMKSPPRTSFERVLGVIIAYALPLAVVTSWFGI